MTAMAMHSSVYLVLASTIIFAGVPHRGRLNNTSPGGAAGPKHYWFTAFIRRWRAHRHDSTTWDCQQDVHRHHALSQVRPSFACEYHLGLVCAIYVAYTFLAGRISIGADFRYENGPICVGVCFAGNLLRVKLASSLEESRMPACAGSLI